MENRVEKVKEIIKENIGNGCCGIYNCRDIMGDPKRTLYEDEDITVDICDYYSYFEILGLNNNEFKQVKEYYDSIVKKYL